MTPGYPKPRVRIVPINVATSSIALADDDPDLIVLDFVTGISGATVYLPASPAPGKSFEIQMAVQPQASLQTLAEVVNVVIPTHRRGTPLTWILGWGQSAKFVFLPDGWALPAGINYGGHSSGYFGVAIGSNSRAGRRGTAVGLDANGNNNGAAFGQQADGNASGAALGYGAVGSSIGVAVGTGALGSNSGVGVGASSNASSFGSGLGYAALATSNGIALGYQASSNSKDSAVAIGYNVTAQRYREFAHGADNATATLRSWSMLDWYGDTSNATPTEILLGGTASQRLTVLASSAFMFSILVVARDNVNNVVSSWKLEGCIKRDGSNNTALVGAVTKTVTAQDAGAAAWDIAATADDTNEALALTVTGAASTTIRWNAMATISEVRF